MAVYWDGMLVTLVVSLPFTFAGATYALGLNNEGNQFKGSMDEVRFWNTILSEDQIRQWMSRKITPDHPAFANLVHYYNFDETHLSRTYDLGTASNGLLVNGPLWVTSGAPIGDVSAVDFTNPLKSPTISLATGEAFNATANSGGPAGISVYEVKDPPNSLTGTLGVGGNDHYFGVFVSGGSTPQYTATYDYTGNSFVAPATEPTLQLFKRNDNSAAIWTNSGATLNTSVNTLTVTGQNTEYILGSSGYALPVTLLRLQARKVNNTTVQITWQTVTEVNNRGFEVQRSFNGNDFTAILFISGAGNSNEIKEYSVTDIPGKYGRVYYRLKQIDFDNNSKLSNVVSVSLDKSEIIKIYPNPAQQSIIIENIEKYYKVEILNAQGQMVRNIVINRQYLLTVDISKFRNGVYLLRLVGEGDLRVERFVVIH